MAEYALSSARTVFAEISGEKSFKFFFGEKPIQLLTNSFEHLEYILNYLGDRQGHLYHYVILNLISEVVGIVNEAEDLVEALVLEFEFEDVLFKKMVEKLWEHNLTGDSFREVYERKVKKLQHKIEDICKSFETYGLRLTRDNQLETHSHASAVNYDRHYPLRECRSSRGSRELIGLDHQRETLVTKLTAECYPSRWSAVFITGMGGIGKTTLAQSIYNHEEIINHFKVRGWVSISQNFTPKRAMVELLMDMTPHGEFAVADLQGLEVPQLKIVIYEFLRRQGRYLVVLDDIWSIQPWKHLMGAFPVIKGSRLVLTTRSNQLALHSDGYMYSMPPLADPWALFQSRAFEVRGEDPELEDIGKHIVDRCEGLPLLIAAVGSFLSKKQWTREWERVRTSMTPLGPRGKVIHVSAILELSYNDLSPPLKSCFLRLGFFPRDTDIPTRKLFHLWAAYGLLADHQANIEIHSSKERAKSYLAELIEKNLVEARKVGVDGEVKTCFVHPSIHELSILKAKEEIYLEVQSASPVTHLLTRTRHKVIFKKGDFQAPSNLRTLVFHLPGGTSLPSNKLIRQVFKNFKLLRVLDMEGLCLEDPSLPRRLGELQNIRYLNLRSTKGMKSLHRSMRYLHMLLMLDIKESEIMGKGLGVLQEMTSLQHVYLGKQRERGSGHLKFGSLTQLRFIGWIFDHELLANEVQTLTSIQKLKLKLSRSPMEAADVQTLWSKIASLEQLENLHLAGESNSTIINPQSTILNIKQLTLQTINVNLELMSVVAKFPHLSVLCLKKLSIERGCSTIKVDGFDKLQYLELSNLEGLQELQITNGNEMCREIRISNCHCDGQALPHGVWSINEAGVQIPSIDRIPVCFMFMPPIQVL